MYKNLIELFKENEGKGAVGAFNLHCFEMLPDVAHVLCLPGRNFPHLYYKYSGMEMQLPRFSRANRSVCIEAKQAI